MNPERRFDWSRFILGRLSAEGLALTDYVKGLLKDGNTRDHILERTIHLGFTYAEISQALNAVGCTLQVFLPRLTENQRFHRAWMLNEQLQGRTLAEYIRGYHEFGTPRAEIIATMANLGFYDEETDGALIELEQGPWKPGEGV